MSRTPVLEVKELTKAFKELTAVDSINFSVEPGVCFGLLGPNGAGKTTTIEMMEGIIEPTSGSVKYFGKPAGKEAYKTLGIQFQQTALQDYLTVREALDLFASFYTSPLPRDSLIDMCDLGDFVDRDHKKLSGGQKQRLLLAIALVNDPQILFLDEPTTGLDPHARRNFWDLITSIKRQNKTIILTTHYMDEAQQLCDDIVIMDRGKIIERGAPNTLLERHFEGGLVQLPRRAEDESKLEGLQLVSDERRIEILAQNVERTIRELMQRQVSLEGLYVKSANLDDLFLKLTGHSLRE